MAGRRPLLGNHQRCWVCGRNAVLATLRAGRWRPWEVRADAATLGATYDEVDALCREADVPLVAAGPAELRKLCRSDGHQGLAAKMPPFPYGTVEDIPAGLVVATDGILDDFNLGAIVRSAEAFGAAGVVIPETGQAGVTSQVVRSSAGAVNGLPIARVPSLVDYLSTRKFAGAAILGASERGATAIASLDLRSSAVLVIGNEGVGLSDEVLSICDERVAIPIGGTAGSLNAAVAAGILIYELTRRKQ